MKKSKTLKRRLFAALMLAVIHLAPQTANAAAEKLPYLIYEGVNTDMTVLWQMTTAESCTIKWGPDTNYTTGSFTTTEYGDDHQHKYSIPNLTPGTNYCLNEQTSYLEEQLRNCSAKWKIVTCHHSVFSPARKRNFQFGRDEWKPLFDKYGVDLVLNGHDHTYARGHVPVRSAAESDVGNLGTVYVTSVSGPKQYRFSREQLESYADEGYQLDQPANLKQFFQVINIENDTLTYVAYTVLGDEYDRAVISKDFGTGTKKLRKESE